jgi:hypothetical protein
MENYARFSKASYEMVKSGDKNKRVNNINKSISDTGFEVVPHLSNRDILYLKNDKTKEHHIAVRGTDASSRGLKKTQDVLTDVKFAMGQEAHDKHFNKKVNRINNLVKEVPSDYKLSLSGHSLGGGVVSEALKKKQNVKNRVDEARTFNSAFSPFSSDPSKATQKKLKDKVIHHRTRHDVVSASSMNHNKLGTVVEQESKDMKHIKYIPKPLQHAFESVDQLRHHTIDQFIGPNEPVKHQIKPIKEEPKVLTK